MTYGKYRNYFQLPKTIPYYVRKKEEQRAIVGKADANSAAFVFDRPLFYVLTNILDLNLDPRHYKVRDILYIKGYVKWSTIIELSLADIKEIQYEDAITGDIIKFMQGLEKQERERIELEEKARRERDEAASNTLPIWYYFPRKTTSNTLPIWHYFPRKKQPKQTPPLMHVGPTC